MDEENNLDFEEDAWLAEQSENSLDSVEEAEFITLHELMSLLEGKQQ